MSSSRTSGGNSSVPLFQPQVASDQSVDVRDKLLLCTNCSNILKVLTPERAKILLCMFVYDVTSIYHAVIVFEGQPLVVDEEIFLLRLHVSDLHSAEVPARALTTVVVPNSETVHDYNVHCIIIL